MKAQLLKTLQQKLWLWGILSEAAYDAEYWTIPLPQPKKKPARTVSSVNRDDIVYVPGAAYEAKTIEDDNTIELTNLKYKKQLAEKLTKADIEQLQLKGLDMTSDNALAKAAEIKKLLVEGKTIAEVVEHYKNKRGYSRPTIGKYFAALNAATAY